MSEKVTKKVELDLELDRLQRAAKTASDAVAGIGGDFSKGFEKKLQSVLQQIDKLRKKASQPIDSAGGFTSLEKGLSAIAGEAKTLFSEITRLQGLTTKEKLSLLPENEATKIKEAIAAIQEYERAITKAEKKRIRDLEANKTSLASKQKDLATKQEEAGTKRKKYTDATSSDTDYGKAKAILEQADAVKKARKEYADLEKTLKVYQKELKEIEKLENKSPEQLERMARLRSDISSVGGKMGARQRVINSGPKETDITAAQHTVDAQAPAIELLEKEAALAEKEVERLQTGIDNLTKKIEDNSATIEASQSDFKILREQAAKLGISLEDVGEEANTENFTLLKTKIQGLVDQGLLPLEQALEAMSPEMQELGSLATDTGEKVRSAGEDFLNAAESAKQIENLKQTFARFVGWTGATKILSAALRNAFSDIKELDEAMTEIAVVTKFDIGDMWEQMPTYTKRANDLGMSITEVYRASALFYQQGLDTNEMMALSNETLKMARIAGLDAAEATDRMTAALRGFNMELNEASAQKVADVYSKLAAITASDVDEISTAMTKTASIASSAGMEFETTAAFLSQIIETTRESAETAGTAMKTVIARFQELKKSPDEIGEIDGEIVDANAIETALRSVGVSLRDASGQFRELDDVFLELSSKWDSLDTNTQRYIATIAAGSRQQSRFIAMMQDYERTQELVTAANNSAGASQEQYDKTLDSLETKLTKLDNAWTEFSTGLMNSDFVKFAVDFLTAILNGLTKVTEGFGSFTGSLSKIGTLIALFQAAKVVITNFFDEIIAKIYTSSTRVGESIARGVQDGINKGPGATLGSIVGISTMGEGLAQMKQAKTLKNTEGRIDNEKAAKWQKDHNNLLGQQASRQKTLNALQEKRTALADKLGETSQEVLDIDNEIADVQDKYAKTEQDLIDLEQERVYTQEEVANMSKTGFQKMCDGAAQAAAALTAVGAGFGMIGQALTSAGLEGAGEVFSEIGKWVTLLGSALMILIPIIKFTGTVFTIEGGKIAVAGTTAQLAWWWVMIILAAIIALAAGIAAGMKAVENNSAEKKLEKMQESADAAAEAADKMQKAYEDLKNSLNDIGDANEKLKNLAHGTDEWREAVESLNNQVIDLIQQYPQLAQFMENKDGILTIDTESAEVQEVLKDAQRTAANAKIQATQAQLNVIEARDLVNYESLDGDAKLDYRDPEKAASGAYAHAFAGSVATGAGLGQFGWFGGPIGALIGTAVGVIGGAIGGIFAGNAAADHAAEQARKQNEAGQRKTESLAMALANGDLRDTGSGFEIDGMSEEEFFEKYGALKDESLEEFYAQVGNSVDSLIDFGQSLNETKKVTSSYYESMAAQVWANTDTSGMSDAAKTIGSNIVDGARYEQKSNAVLDELSEVDMLADNEGKDAIGGDLASRRSEAIQKAYGDGAKLQEGEDGWEIVDAKGEVLRSNVTSDDVKNIIASSEATAELEEVARLMPQITSDILNGLAKDMTIKKEDGTEVQVSADKVEDAVIAALQDESGENLTKDQLEIVREIMHSEEGALEELYNSSEAIQKAFGSAENFVQTFGTATSNASQAFNQTAEFLKNTKLNTGGLSSGALIGLTNEKRLGSLYQKGSQEEINNFETAFNNIMDSPQAEKVAQYMNSIDWSNQDQLIKMQYELQDIYGVSSEDAKALAQSMIAANDATSSLSVTAKVFDKLYRATEKLNKSAQKLADQQWDHERLVRNGASAAEIANSLEERKTMLYQRANDALDNYNIAKEKEVDIFAEGVDRIAGIDLTKYVKYDAATGSYDVSELSDRMDNMSKEQKEAAKQWIEDLDEVRSTAQDQLDVAKDSYVELEDMAEDSKEAYEKIYDQFSDLIIAQHQQEIDLLQDQLDAEEEANGELLDKMQQQIDDARAAREEEKAEQNLNDLAKRISYLKMDSSGANALEIASLEKQLQEDTEAFTDAQIDKQLQRLQDDNETAMKQRQKQIDIQQLQLDEQIRAGELEAEIQAKVDEYFDAYFNYKTQEEAWQNAQKMATAAAALGQEEQTRILTAVQNGDDEYLKNVFPDATLAEIEMYKQLVTATGSVQGSVEGLKEGVVTTPSFDDTLIQTYTDFVAAGVIDGQTATKNTFTQDLIAATGTAGSYKAILSSTAENTGETEENTAGATDENGGKQSMAQLLSKIQANTASERDAILTEQEKIAIASRQLAGLTDSGTNFGIVPSKGTDGQYSLDNKHNDNALKLAKWLDMLGSEAKEKLESSNDAAAELYKQMKDAANVEIQGEDALEILSAYDYYTTLDLDEKQGYLYDFAESGKSDLSYEKYLEGIRDSEEAIAVRNSEVSNAAGYASNNRGGRSGMSAQEVADFQAAKQRYITYGGTAEQFEAAVKEKITGGSVDNVKVTSKNNLEKVNLGKTPTTGDMVVKMDDQKYTISARYATKANSGEKYYDVHSTGYMGFLPTNDIGSGWIAMKNNQLYIYSDAVDSWLPITYDPDDFKSAYINKLAAYKTGGLADFTGPAWLDGTPSRPEYVLNADQTAAFFSLIDVLDGLKSESSISNTTSGDNYFDISINVEKIEDDYDVEQIADKIRRMIYDDASYRNVNTINLTH